MVSGAGGERKAITLYPPDTTPEEEALHMLNTTRQRTVTQGFAL